MKQKEILISQGSRPWWQKIIAAIFFTGMFYYLYLFIANYHLFDPNKSPRQAAAPIKMIIYLFTGGVGFSLVREHHFDFNNRKYKINYCVGPIKIGQWKRFKKLEYISIFKKKSGIYEINLWYNHNKHFTLFSCDDPLEGLDAGKQVAEKLEIDLWDATNPYDSKWMEKNL